MFDFKSANAAQREAIAAADGPVLIIAGPGTGKTFTLVQRTAYLIQEKGVRPEEIMLVTFTEKAARELITRITEKLDQMNLSVNLGDMYIGTFHSVCMRLIREHLEATEVRRNCRCMDAFDQHYLIYRHIVTHDGHFTTPSDTEEVLEKATEDPWDIAGRLCGLVNELREELVTPEALRAAGGAYETAVANILEQYITLLRARGDMDFTEMQVQAYELLRRHPEILEQVQQKIKYIMVDEYQDTNTIQEQILFLLVGAQRNLCVVGDDDQALYRFRGATVRNILEFPDRFPAGVCKVVRLEENYRSDRDILRTCTRWIAPDGFQWSQFRHEKHLVTGKPGRHPDHSVVRIGPNGDEAAWQEENLQFVRQLLYSGKIQNLNQIAFLFNSVRSNRARQLANYLEAGGIPVYAPRADLFFQREEVKLSLGLLLLCFPDLAEVQKKGKPSYLRSCLNAARALIRQPESAVLRAYLQENRYQGEMPSLHGLSAILMGCFSYAPFKDWLSTDMKAGAAALRPARNLALLQSACLSRFDAACSLEDGKPHPLAKAARDFFEDYLPCLMASGIQEYEDAAEYAPKDCVSFLTVHQAKGMEFPVVVVCVPMRGPYSRRRQKLDQIRTTLYRRTSFEPLQYTPNFDFLRLWYTAFSRAQNLLVLSCPPGTVLDQWYCKALAEPPLWNDPASRSSADRLTFEPVKEITLRDSYSFTTHAALYDSCPLRYKFYRELRFPQPPGSGQVFGTLVHETIEDIHKAALRGESDQINETQIRTWLENNAADLQEAEHLPIYPKQRDAAFRQVMGYVRWQGGDWSRIRDAEMCITLTRPGYILRGNIDLIQGDGDTVEIVDFKSDAVRPAEGSTRMEKYRKQLMLYAWLVQRDRRCAVSKLHLYFTAADQDPVYTIPFQQEDIREAAASFDRTVAAIKEKKFDRPAKDPAVCVYCAFARYCGKASPFAEGRLPVVQIPAPADPAVTAALAPIPQQLAGLPRKPKLMDQFWHNLGKELLKGYLQQAGLTVQDYDTLRRDEYRGYSPYDLAVNGHLIQVRAYCERAVGYRCKDVLARRNLFLPQRPLPIVVQVAFLPGNRQSAGVHPQTPEELAANLGTLLRGCAACIVGWVSDGDVYEALQQEQEKLSLASTRDLPELLQVLRGEPGPAQICPTCGQILRLCTNRRTGEKFMGCPGYRQHPAKNRA